MFYLHLDRIFAACERHVLQPGERYYDSAEKAAHRAKECECPGGGSIWRARMLRKTAEGHPVFALRGFMGRVEAIRENSLPC